MVKQFQLLRILERINMSSKKGSFTRDFNRLQQLVEEFENSELDLEESVIKFKQGLKLAQSLKKRLKTIENQVKEIKDQAQGE